VRAPTAHDRFSRLPSRRLRRARPAQRLAQRLACGLALGAVWLSVGCEPRPRLDSGAGAPPPKDAPSTRELVESHNQRVSNLGTTYSQGVIEIHWTDDKGEHSHQGDLEFWQTDGNRTALSISKLGERLFWLGSNAEQYWLFDLSDRDRRVLYLGRHDQPLERFGALGVKPLALLDLLGLTSLDAGALPGADQPARYDSQRQAWVIEAPGRGGRMRLYFDMATLLPKRIEELDEAGAVVAEADLSREQRVAVPGVAIMARPQMPTKITIRRPQHQGGKAGEKEDQVTGYADIFINQTTTDAPRPTAFDLDALRKAMRPDREVIASDAP